MSSTRILIKEAGLRGPKGDTGPQGPIGPAGGPLPTGGTDGQVVTKVAGTAQWADPTGGGGSGVPVGGTTGQSLFKNTSANGDVSWKDLGVVVHAMTSKTTPVDADEVLLVDSEATNVGKRFSWANIKAGIESAVAAATMTFTNKDFTGAGNTFPTFNQDTTGNADTATTLATPRNIAGQAFDGSADITISAADVDAQPASLGSTPTATSGVVVVDNGTTDAAILALGLPDGTIIIEKAV